MKWLSVDETMNLCKTVPVTKHGFQLKGSVHMLKAKALCAVNDNAVPEIKPLISAVSTSNPLTDTSGKGLQNLIGGMQNIVIESVGSDEKIPEAVGQLAVKMMKNNNLISRLEGVPDEKRTARFVCAMAAVFPDGREETVVGTMEGRIGYEIAGENGFGYDPIFYLPEYGKTSAEISPEEKNAISHRGKALRAIAELL